MTLRLYNTLSRQREEFEPHDPANVRMYVCGPTVYDEAHIGNARPVIVFDVLYRLLRAIYGTDNVTYARNITDVDDKIIDAARSSGQPIAEITKRTTAAYHRDIGALNNLKPDLEPHATEHIDQMITLIEALIARGNAYEADGHVLFEVASMTNYGKLSGNPRDEILAGARVEVAPYKKDGADFVLWKPSTDNQPGWDSPWGFGRPGWHLECSAMSGEHLGLSFDIHGGGQDLIFPHHENEIAQSRCAYPEESFAKYWMHNGYLMVEGEKMSKSLGNFVTVNHLLKNWPGEAIRFAMLKTHYRQPINWSERGLREAKAELDRFYGALRNRAGIAAEVGDGEESVACSALFDDLNTPQAIADLHATLGSFNAAETEDAAKHAKGLLLCQADLLGLLQQDPEEWFRWQSAVATSLDDDEIESLIERRAQARANKNFTEADRIRVELAATGVVLEDSAQGTTWRRA